MEKFKMKFPQDWPAGQSAHVAGEQVRPWVSNPFSFEGDASERDRLKGLGFTEVPQRTVILGWPVGAALIDAVVCNGQELRAGSDGTATFYGDGEEISSLTAMGFTGGAIEPMTTTETLGGAGA